MASAATLSLAKITRYNQSVYIVISGKFTGLYIDPTSPPDKRHVIGHGDLGNRLNLKMYRRVKEQFPEFTFSEDVLPIEFTGQVTYWNGVVEHGEYYKFTDGDVSSVIFSVKKIVVGYNEDGKVLPDQILETIVKYLPDFGFDPEILPRIHDSTTIFTQDFDDKKKLRYVSGGPSEILGLVFNIDKKFGTVVGMGPRLRQLNMSETITAIRQGFKVPRSLRDWVEPFDLSDPVDAEKKVFSVISGPLRGLMLKKMGSCYEALGMYRSREPLSDEIIELIKDQYPMILV